tara:strand:- start:6 stop:857 length:852 start_codon:yes stop_codon:yes gene_type:complete
MPILKFKNPLVISGSDGFISSNTGQLDATNRQTSEFSIGQDVGTDQEVTFNGLTQPENQTLILPNPSDASQNLVLGYEFISGSNITFTTEEQGISENYTHEDNLLIDGEVSAKTILTELSSSEVIFTSGSTKFGDTLDDKHEVTGSMTISGSFSLNNSNMVGVSNNSDVSAARQNFFVTENVAFQVLGGEAEVANLFLRKQFAKVGTITSPTASFTAVTASAGDLTATSINDFHFYLNGMILENDALTIEQDGSTFKLHMDTGSLGYNLTNDDEIVAWGKFNS